MIVVEAIITLHIASLLPVARVVCYKGPKGSSLAKMTGLNKASRGHLASAWDSIDT